MMSGDIQVAILIADATGLAHEPLLRNALTKSMTNAVVRSAPIASAARLFDEPLLSARAMHVAQAADIVYVLAPEKGTTTNAVLIELRERVHRTIRVLENALMPAALAAR